MAVVSFWLEWWEYECCAPRRKVGDHVSVQVISSHDQMWEARHEVPEDPRPLQTLTGTVEEIYWHPQRYERAGDREWSVTGHGPAVRIDDTEKSPTRLEQQRLVAEQRERVAEQRKSAGNRRGRWRAVPGRWVGMPVNESPPDYGYDLEFVITVPDDKLAQ